MINKCATIGIVGCFQNGKSTLVNCLLDDKVAMTGDGRATTHLSTVYEWGHVQQVKGFCAKDNALHLIPFHNYIEGYNLPKIDFSHFEVNLWKPLLQHVNVMDTPGFEDCDEDNETATRSLDKVDFVVFVVTNKALSQIEIGLIKTITRQSIPFTVLMNCKSTSKGLWEPFSQANQLICQQIESSLKAIGHPPYPIHGQYVWPVNLAWFWYATQHMHRNDLGEAEKDLFDDIQYFISKSLNLSTDDCAILAEKSNFLPFREAIQLIATHYGHVNSESGEMALSHLRIVEDAIDNAKLDEAMIFAERACYIAPGFKPAIYSRALVCFERKEYDETVQSTTDILKIDARDIETLFLRAKANFEKKEYGLSKIDLCRVADLLKSEWHITWEDSDKVIQATKLVNTYLMKMECEQRDGNSAESLETLRYIVKCEQKPLNDIVDLPLKLTVLALLATLEFNGGNNIEVREVAGHALKLLHEQKEEVPNIEKLQSLYNLFGLTNFTKEAEMNGKTITINMLRVLWKACLALSNSNIEQATIDFTEKMSYFPPQSVWIDEPEFVPYFISYMGRKYDSIDVESYVKQYFNLTKDENLSSFARKASACLYGKTKTDLDNSLKLKCKIKINTMLNMNSIELINSCFPVLSELNITVIYKANDVAKSIALSESNTLLPNGSSYKWTNVFEGKSIFGSMFGGNKISNVEITAVSSKQGRIEDVEIGQ